MRRRVLLRYLPRLCRSAMACRTASPQRGRGGPAVLDPRPEADLPAELQDPPRRQPRWPFPNHSAERVPTGLVADGILLAASASAEESCLLRPIVGEWRPGRTVCAAAGFNEAPKSGYRDASFVREWEERPE